jgi:tetratricopeptide (TPR) repeat protein
MNVRRRQKHSVLSRQKAVALLCATLFLLLSGLTIPGYADAEVGQSWTTTLEKAEQSAIDGDASTAKTRSEQALSLATDDTTKAIVMNQMGVIAMKAHRFKDAEALFSQALELRRKLLGPESSETLQTLSNYALATYKLGDQVKAENLYQQCIELKRKTCPATASLANTLTNLAHIYNDERRCDEAKKLYTETLAIDKTVFGAKHQEVGNDLFNLGASLYHCQDFSGAIDYLTQANDTFTAVPDKYGSVKALHYISLCYFDLKDYDKSCDFSLRALSLHEEIKGKGHPDTQIHLFNAVKALRAKGDLPQADELCKRALAAAQSAPVANNLILTECNLELALLYRDQKHTDDADVSFKSALVHYDLLTKKEKRALYELPLAYCDMLRQLKRTKECDYLAHKYLDVYAPEK